MAGKLGDDGTMDTVIYCDECGQEQRYNYDSGPRDEQDTADRIAELRAKYPTAHDSQITARLDRQLYDEFVAWAVEDFESEHTCPK